MLLRALWNVIFSLSCIFWGLSVFASSDSEQDPLVEARKRCSAPSSAPILYDRELTVGDGHRYELEELAEYGRKIYEGSQRHPQSFYYSSSENSFVFQDTKSTIRIPNHFLRKMLAFLAQTLNSGKVRSLITQDMGHGHFNVPSLDYDELWELPGGFTQQHYDKILKNPNLKVLFHSAERLIKLDANYKRVPFPEYQSFIDNRNIVGDFATGDISFLPPSQYPINSIGSIDGYKGYGSINFTWNKKGCFPISTHEGIKYVDFSFDSLTGNPAIEREPNFDNHRWLE